MGAVWFILVVALLNTGLGFAIAVHLGRRYRAAVGAESGWSYCEAYDAANRLEPAGAGRGRESEADAGHTLGTDPAEAESETQADLGAPKPDVPTDLSELSDPPAS